ncbi:MAG: hypothetical protein JWO38_5635 [Gemmataceae bacterium]|nr:hypothetical protein [Gemmataceae bacterium]
MDEQISVRQAYLAMYSFLEELYTKYEFDQFGSILGGMSLLADGSPADQAVWADWLKAVERVREQQVDATLRIRHTK